MLEIKFLEMRTRSALKKNKKLHASMPYEKAQRIGILFSVEDKQKHAEIKDFVHVLEQDGKKVNVLEYLPLKAENYEFMFDFFTLKDLSFWGEIKSESARKFSEISFDYLFYIDRELNPLTRYILANSKAKCRVGNYRENEHLFFELMIEQKGNNKKMIEMMLKYTKLLR